MSRGCDLAAGIAARLTQAKDELNELDGYAGDGDLGLTVATACAAVVDLLPGLQDALPSELLRRIGLELSRRAPSTSGTLVAFALIAAGRDCATTESAYDTVSLARILRVITTTIATRGKSAPGDKTMLDALTPATTAAESAAARSAGPAVGSAEPAAGPVAAGSAESVSAGPIVSAAARSAVSAAPAASLAAAAQLVADAAAAGAAATAAMAPRHGRAAWLADRSAGHEDAGARLVALALGALALTVREKEKTS